MGKQLTPAEAFGHIQALFPGIKDIKRNGLHAGVICTSKTGLENYIEFDAVIDWGDLNRYPPEPAWRDAVWPDDWNKEARFSDHADKDGTTTLSRLCGLYKDPDCHHWLDASNSCWDKCQVRVTDEEHIADAGKMVDDAWLPMDTAPKDDVKVFLLMGGEQVIGGWTQMGKMWISLSRYSKSLDWDKANQPTRWRPLP